MLAQASVYQAACNLWAIPVLAVKLTDQGGMYSLPAFELESDLIFDDFGHEEGTCTSQAPVRVVELPASEEDLAVEV